MLIIAITYQTRPQGLLSCRSHIGKREDPGDEAGHIFIGHMRVRLGSTFLELHCGQIGPTVSSCATSKWHFGFGYLLQQIFPSRIKPPGFQSESPKSIPALTAMAAKNIILYSVVIESNQNIIDSQSLPSSF